LDLNHQYRKHQGLLMAAAASNCALDRQRKIALAQDCAANIAAFQRNERAPAAAGWAPSVIQDTQGAVFPSEYPA
jgi:hypothetical protein